MVLDHEGEHPSRWAAATSIAGKIGCSTHTLMDWVKKVDIEAGRTSGVPAEVRPDAVLRTQIRRVWGENFRVYGVRKVWRQLRREGIEVAHCTMARPMKQIGLVGVIRGKPVKTTVSNPAVPCARDKVNRGFRAAKPNALWISDFTYVATWQGFVYVAFVIDSLCPSYRRLAGVPFSPNRVCA